MCLKSSDDVSQPIAVDVINAHFGPSGIDSAPATKSSGMVGPRLLIILSRMLPPAKGLHQIDSAIAVDVSYAETMRGGRSPGTFVSHCMNQPIARRICPVRLRVSQ